MVNSSYLLWMAGSALVAAVFHFFLARGLKKRALLAGLTLILGAVLGIVCAKLFYCLTQIQYFRDDVNQAGLWQALIPDDMAKMSFYGGAMGVILGAVLAAKITGNGVAGALNAYAPAGALMAALARFGEYFLGLLCAGSLHMDAEWTHSFLLAVPNRWNTWYLAVFSLAGVVYLIVCALSLFLLKKKRFVRTVYYLCLPQIMLESLRNQSLIFHEFVRIEQLLCMIVMVAILILYGVWAGNRQKKRFLPALLSLVCAGVFVAAEFALDGKLGESLRYGIPYIAMGLGMAALAVLECWGFSMAAREAEQAA